MNIHRRRAILTSLFGAGWVGLRAAATGLPLSFLLNPRKALANMPCAGSGPTPKPAQFVIFSTSGTGDPINANCPGSYVSVSGHQTLHADVPGFAFNGANAAPTFDFNGQQVQAAAPWATLLSDSSVASRTAFIHMATNQLIHPAEPLVLQLGTSGGEMLPSLIAEALQPILGTVQAQPVCVGATSPAEAIDFKGAPQPILPPSALQDTLLNPSSKGGAPLTNLQGIRDHTMNKLYGIYKNVATPQQQQYLDQLITSQAQVRQLSQCVLGNLSSIGPSTDPVAAQIIAAVTLIQLNVSPVVTIHVPFGGDNHADTGFAKSEVPQTLTGVGTANADGGAAGTPSTGLAFLLSTLAAAGLQDQVSFMNLNVFGRTLSATGTAGRGHLATHHVSVCIGKPFKGGVVGGVAPTPNGGYDWSATPINGIQLPDLLNSFALTVLQAVGAPPSYVSNLQNGALQGGQVLSSALA